MTALERRYRLWLLAYPEEYRRAHEAELLDTLVQAAAPGQAWPSGREVAALVAGGLCTRARLAAASPGRVWADGLRWGVILYVALAAASAMNLSLYTIALGQNVSQANLLHLQAAGFVLGVVALAAGSYELGLVAPVATLVVQADMFVVVSWRLYQVVATNWVLVAVLLAVLAWHPRLRRFRRPLSLRHGALALGCVGLTALCFLALDRVPALSAIGMAAPEFTVPAGFLLLLAVVARDLRPALAATVYVAAGFADSAQTLFALSRMAGFETVQLEVQTLVILGAAVVALAVTVLSARHRVMI